MVRPTGKPSTKRKRALITGASTGLGAAFAERLAQAGYDVVLVARDRPRLERLAEKLQSSDDIQAEVLAADLTDPTELHKVERAAASGHVDLLVNNAGFGTYGRFSQLDIDREEEEVRLNVIALVRLTRAVLPPMIEAGQGGIINVSSMAGFQAGPFNATYCATKAYVTSFTESVSEELRGTGVRIQALCPGFTRTEFQQRAGIDVARVPSMAWMNAEEVVDASLAALANGDVICVPGLTNRVVSTLTAAIPRGIARRLVGYLVRP